MDEVLIGRLLTGMTLGFHIIFATIGVGVPIVFMVLEFLGLRKKDALLNDGTAYRKRLYGYRCSRCGNRNHNRTAAVIDMAGLYETRRSNYSIAAVYGNLCVFL